jgi:hypothetical protein
MVMGLGDAQKMENGIVRMAVQQLDVENPVRGWVTMHATAVGGPVFFEDPLASDAELKGYFRMRSVIMGKHKIIDLTPRTYVVKKRFIYKRHARDRMACKKYPT